MSRSFEISCDPAPTAYPRSAPPLRVALICDFLEEHWPSMDLVGDMLRQHLAQDIGASLAATQLRPKLRRRLARLPVLPRKLAWNVDRLLNRTADYPRWLRSKRGDFDVFHLIDHSYSQLVHVLPADRTVVTCHDLDTFRCLLEPQLEDRPRWFRAMTERILDGFRQAAHVIAVSQATRDQLLRYALLPAERISVIHNGVHPGCSPSPNPAADLAAAQLLPDEDGFTIWLLNVGSTQPRKRLDILLRAFAAIHRQFPQTRLARVGGWTPAHAGLIRELGIERHVIQTPFLEHDVLAAVYRRATLLLHTAEAEGFGLPLVEAMACGCPVIASDLPVLREVGGPAAYYCRVGDVNAWPPAVIEILEEKLRSPAEWEARRQHSLAWASHFSWRENARQTAAVYCKVAEAR